MFGIKISLPNIPQRLFCILFPTTVIVGFFNHEHDHSQQVVYTEQQNIVFLIAFKMTHIRYF